MAAKRNVPKIRPRRLSEDDLQVQDFARQILFGESISDKLFEADNILFDNTHDLLDEIPKTPARAKKIQLGDKNIRFPRGHFHLNEKKAIALHSFANHELLAIEMMAAALLIYPHQTPEQVQFKKGIITTLRDEQKHFKLYIERLHQIGHEFGDFELNDYFWSQMSGMKTPAQYMSVMALTFEAANLDFAKYYHEQFLAVDDHQTAAILEIVLKDEISHVALGATYLNRWRGDKKLCDYYFDNLPGNLTPARAKGKIFNADLRKQARLDDEFIQWIDNYQDDFKITQRKEWKK